MQAGAGYSQAKDSRQAGIEAAEMAAVSSGPPVFTFLFTTLPYDQQEILAGVKQVTGDSRLVGFCGSGIVTSDGVLTRGVGVCTLAGEELRVATTLQRGLSSDPAGAGARAGDSLLSSGLSKGLALIVPDGFQANVSSALRGFYNRVGPDFRYAGGGAGDNLKAFNTFQFTEERVEGDALAAALIGGMENTVGIGHGWKPIGDPLLITRAEERRVMEIDGAPAFAAYSKRLGGVGVGQFPSTGMRHPLGFPDIEGNYLIRDPLLVHEDGSIEFVSEIPEHAVGNIMDGQIDDLVATAALVARNTIRKIRKPRFVLLFECVSRYLLMGRRFEEEVGAILREIGEGVPAIGGLTFGEVGSFGDVPLLHNKTAVLVVGGDGVE